MLASTCACPHHASSHLPHTLHTGHSVPVHNIMGDLQDQVRAVACAAHASSFHRLHIVHAPVHNPTAARAQEAKFSSISANALAHLLHLRGLASIANDAIVIDVRRHDEVALYGLLPEARHLPLPDLIVALAAPKAEFKQLTRFDRPYAQQLVVFFSRRQRRAELAALVATSHGALRGRA